MAQCALYETAMVDMPQMFFPFATDAKGQTLYEKMVEGKFLLGPGREDTSTEKTRRRTTPGLRKGHAETVCPSRKEAPLGRVNSASHERMQTHHKYAVRDLRVQGAYGAQ